MFEYIRGKLESKAGNYLVVDNNGIGFRIYTSSSTLEKAGQPGNDITVYTHLYFREEIMDIYGFITQEELRMFRLLLSVSGIGPKAAISLLSTITPSGFAMAIIAGDTSKLTKAQGIGNKTAQRLILELKDKIKKEQLGQISNEDEAGGAELDSDTAGEAVGALLVLGYTALEANRAVRSVYSEGMPLEEIIRSALRDTSKR
ncbi:MAG: Holliday junction branch migration protein RuvA [Eubacteriales bacterium]|nr:Holliday junction branch migration protein RuvA [Eubacteriales bacterium]